MDKKVRGDPDVPYRYSRKMQYSGMPGEASKADLAAQSFGDTRSRAAGDAEGDERRGNSQLNRRLGPEDAVPGDARGHIVSETGQAAPGTLGEAKQVALEDQRGGETRNSITG